MLFQLYIYILIINCRNGRNRMGLEARMRFTFALQIIHRRPQKISSGLDETSMNTSSTGDHTEKSGTKN